MTDYTGTGIGYRAPIGGTAAINDSGLTVGGFTKYDGTTSRGTRSVMWEAGDAASTELAILTTNSSGTTNSRAYDVNSSGLIAGTAQTYQGNLSRGVRPVVWDASGNLIQLGTLGASSTGTASGTALFINDSGVVAGTAQKYDSGNLVGARPVRWTPPPAQRRSSESWKQTPQASAEPPLPALTARGPSRAMSCSSPLKAKPAPCAGTRDPPPQLRSNRSA